MKKSIRYIPFLMLILAFTFNSCSDNEADDNKIDNLKSKSILLKSKDFGHIGIEHNRILNRFLLKNNNTNNQVNKLAYIKDFIIEQ